MKIIIPLIVVFIILFLLIFKWIYSDNKNELEEKKANLFHVIGTAFVLALAPTVAIALVLLALFGSTTIVNTLFSLHITTNQLMLLSISLFIYLYSIDSIIAVAVEHTIGKNIFHPIALLLIRILAFYMIGLVFGLNQTSSFIIAAGVAFIIFFIEVFEVLHQTNEKTS